MDLEQDPPNMEGPHASLVRMPPDPAPREAAQQSRPKRKRRTNLTKYLRVLACIALVVIAQVGVQHICEKLHAFEMNQAFFVAASESRPHDASSAQLNYNSYIEDDGSSNIRHLGFFMKSQGVQLPKPTQAMLQYLEFGDQGPLLPDSDLESQQYVYTQMRSVEGLLDGDSISFENSIGVMNLQQFFTDSEKPILSDQYLIEDILVHRVIQLANLTCSFVYDDSGENIRQNPQFHQLREFHEINKLLRNCSTSNETGLEDMSHFFLEAKLRPRMLGSLQQALNFSIVPTTVKHTGMYTELQRNDSAVRVSYKQAKSRFLKRPPFYAQSKMEDVKEQVSLQTPAESQPLFLPPLDLHQRELQIVDDLVVDILNHKETADLDVYDEEAVGSADKDQGVSARYKERHYSRRACEDAKASKHEDYSRLCDLGPAAKEVMSESHEPTVTDALEYPVEEIALSESNRVLRKIVSMRALHLHKANFDKLCKYFEQKQPDFCHNITNFSQVFYSYEEPSHIKKLTQGIEPKQISELATSGKDHVFFEDVVEISPRKLLVREPIHLLTPYVDTIRVKNERARGNTNIVITDVLTSSPEVDAQVEGPNGRQQLPVTVKPGESVTIRVTASPENYGRFDALVYIVFKHRVYVTTFRAHVSPNRFGLEPIYLDHVPYLSQVSQRIVIANPYKKDLKVDELYNANKKFEVKPFKLAIGADSNVTFGNLTYYAKDAKPEYEHTIIRIRFSSGDYLQVPVYVRTVNNLVEMSPPVMDFGLVQLNQQPIKMDLWLTVNINSVQRIVDYYLPTDQENLDFAMLDPAELALTCSVCQEKKQRRANERTRRLRKACVDSQTGFTSFFAGSVYLDPTKAGFVSTSIKMEVELRPSTDKGDRDVIWLEGTKMNRSDILAKVPHSENGTIYVELPIIASVVNHTKMFSAVQLPELLGAGPSEPLPLYLLNTSKDQRHAADLVLKNNLNVPLTINKIRPGRVGDSKPLQPFHQFEFQSSNSQLIVKLGKFAHQPGDVITYGTQTLKSPLKYARYVIWIKASPTANHSGIGGVLIPQTVVAYTGELLCQWQEESRVNACQDMFKLDFGVMGTELIKTRVLKVANPNPVAIGLEQIIKSQPNFVTVNLIEVKDKRGRPVPSQWQPDSLVGAREGETAPELIGPTRQQRFVGLQLPPYHSVFIGFTVTSEAPTESQSVLQLTFSGNTPTMKLAAIYKVVEATLAIWPPYVDFLEAHQHMPQQEEIEVTSDLGVPLTITSTKTGDKRITVRLSEQDEETTKAIIAYEPEFTFYSQRQVDYFVRTQRWVIDTKSDKTKGKSGTGINRKLNDEIADRERLDRANGRIFEYFKQTGPGEFEMKFNRPDSSGNWFQLPMNTFDQRIGVVNLFDFYHQRVSRYDNDLVLRELPANQSRNASDHSSGLYEPVDHDFKLGGNQQVLNAKDFLTFVDHEKQWQDILRDGEAFIDTTVVLETEEMGPIEVPVTAELREPRVTEFDDIDFGQIQIGQAERADLHLTNPTKKHVQLQLFLGYDLDHPLMRAADTEFNGLDSSILREVLERHVELYMVGIDLRTVEQIDTLFETFRSRHLSPRPDINKYTTPHEKSDSIVDILLRFSKEHEEAIYQEEIRVEKHTQALLDVGYPTYDDISDLLPYYLEETELEAQRRRAEEDIKREAERAEAAAAALDDVFDYYQWYRGINRHNFISKYCVRLFQEHRATWPDDDLESILRSVRPDPSQLFSDRRNPVKQCVRAIQTVHELMKARVEQKCSSGDFSIESLQHGYKVMYEQAYDPDSRVEKCMEVSQMEQPFAEDGTYTDEDEALRSLLFFESLMSWKRREIEFTRLSTSKTASIGTLYGPNARLQEHYSHYLGQNVHLTSAQYQRYSTKEMRLKIMDELAVNDVHRALLRMRRQELTDPSDLEIDERLVERAWARERGRQNAYYDKAQAIQRELDLTDVSLFLNHIGEVVMWAVDQVSQFFYLDAYQQAKLSYAEQSGEINPLSSLEHRFRLKQEDIWSEMITNNVRWLRNYHELRESALSFEEASLGNQYLNEEMRLQMLHRRMEAMGKRLQPGPFQVQNYYLSVRYRGQVIELPPESNLTLFDAVIYEPQVLEQNFNAPLAKKLKQQGMDHLIANIDQKSIPMNLYIKNNLTHLEKVELRGRASSAYLEAVDVKKELWFSAEKSHELISVSDSATVLLRALEGSLDGPSLEHLEMFGFDEMTQLDRRLKRQVEMRQILRGSDFHVINSLFSDYMAKFEYDTEDLFSYFAYPTKTRYRNPFERNEDTDLQGWEDNIKLDPTADRDFIAAFPDFKMAQQAANAASEVMHMYGYDHKQENFETKLRKHDRSFFQTMQEQSFQNYIVINIPMSDIFRAPVPVMVPSKPKKARELVDIDLLAEDESDGTQCTASNRNGQCGKAFLNYGSRYSLFFMDDIWFDMANQKPPREQIHLIQEQRRKRFKFKEKPSLRQIIAQGLEMWDRQDLRIDINWTEFQSSLKRHDVGFFKVQRRTVVLQNTGVMPLTVTDLVLDDKKCGIDTDLPKEELDPIFITNCDKIINSTYGPSTNISIDLQLNEDYQFSKKRKTLIMETEFFTQAFNIDILIPEKAINLVQDFEQHHNRHKSSFFSICALIGNVLFLAMMLYFTCFFANILKKDFEAQVNQDFRRNMTEDETRNIGSELNNQQRAMISRYKTFGLFGDKAQIQFGPKADETDQKSNSSITSILDPQLSQEHLANEFDQLCETSFVMDVLPNTSEGRWSNVLLNKFINDVDRVSLQSALEFINEPLQIYQARVQEEKVEPNDEQIPMFDSQNATRVERIDGIEWIGDFADHNALQQEVMRRMNALSLRDKQTMTLQFRTNNGRFSFAFIWPEQDSEEPIMGVDRPDIPIIREEPKMQVIDRQLQPEPAKRDVEVTYSSNMTKKQKKQLLAQQKLLNKQKVQAEKLKQEQQAAKAAAVVEQPPDRVPAAEAGTQPAGDAEDSTPPQAEVMQGVTNMHKTERKKILKALNRKEQKKLDTRRQRDAELIENARRQEAVANRLRQMKKKEGTPSEKIEKSDKSASQDSVPDMPRASSNPRSQAERLPSLQPQRRLDFEIESYHSSQENKKKRKRESFKQSEGIFKTAREKVVTKESESSEVPRDRSLTPSKDGTELNAEENEPVSKEEIHISQEPEPESRQDTGGQEQDYKQADSEILHSHQTSQEDAAEEPRKYPPRRKDFESRHPEWERPKDIEPFVPKSTRRGQDRVNEPDYRQKRRPPHHQNQDRYYYDYYEDRSPHRQEYDERRDYEFYRQDQQFDYEEVYRRPPRDARVGGRQVQEIAPEHQVGRRYANQMYGQPSYRGQDYYSRQPHYHQAQRRDYAFRGRGGRVRRFDERYRYDDYGYEEKPSNYRINPAEAKERSHESYYDYQYRSDSEERKDINEEVIRRRETTLQRDKPRGLGTRREYAFVQKTKMRPAPKRPEPQQIYKVKARPAPVEEGKQEEQKKKRHEDKNSDASADSRIKQLNELAEKMLDVSEESKKSTEEMQSPPTEKVASQDEESKQAKSAFDTFMDVSSIFANPLFGGDMSPDPIKVQKEEDFEEEKIEQKQISIQATPIKVNFGARKNTTANPRQVQAQPMGRNDEQQTFMGDIMNYSNFGIGMMEPGLNTNANSPSSLPFVDAQMTGLLRQISDEPSGEAGLSQSSLANLRRRLEAGRGQDQRTTEIPQHSMMHQPFIIQQQHQAANQKPGMMGSLPVPRFLQERQERGNIMQSPIGASIIGNALEESSDEDEPKLTFARTRGTKR